MGQSGDKPKDSSTKMAQFTLRFKNYTKYDVNISFDLPFKRDMHFGPIKAGTDNTVFSYNMQDAADQFGTLNSVHIDFDVPWHFDIHARYRVRLKLGRDQEMYDLTFEISHNGMLKVTETYRPPAGDF